MAIPDYVTYSRIAASPAHLRTVDAVVLVIAAAQACGRHSTLAACPGLPDLDEIRLSASGDVSLTSAGPAMSDAGRALQLASLVRRLLGLEEHGGANRVQVPGALLVLIARAAREIDLPPMPCVAFVKSLGRFGTADPATLAAVFQRSVGQAATRSATLPAPRSALAAASTVASARAASTREPPNRHFRIVPPSETQPDTHSAPIRRGMRSSAAVAASLTAAAVAVLVFWAGPAERPQHGEAAGRMAARAQPHPEEVSGADVPYPARAAGPQPSEPPSAADAPPTVVVAEVPPRRPERAVTERDAVTVRPLLSAARVGADVFSPSFAAGTGDVLFHAGRSGAALMRASFLEHEPPALHLLVNDGAANYHAALSPDGTWLAYDSDRDGTRGVYVARLDGTGVRRVSGDGYAAVPRWSPDGRRLAFVRAEPSRPRVWNVWVADLEAPRLLKVSHHSLGQAWGGSWFPDGTRLAYSVEDTLVIAGVESRIMQVLRSPRAGRLVRTPAVSPDGARIIFQVHGDGVWLLDVATGAMRRLIADRAAEEFSWSPDGQRVVYHTRREGTWSLWQLGWEGVG